MKLSEVGTVLKFLFGVRGIGTVCSQSTSVDKVKKSGSGELTEILVKILGSISLDVMWVPGRQLGLNINIE